MLASGEDEADLRPVAVGYHYSVAAFEEIRDVAGGFNNRCVLVAHALGAGILDERVATDGYDEGLHAGAPGRVHIVSHGLDRASISEPFPANKCAALGKT